MSCWMIPRPQPPCFVLGGRFGDIIQLLPCFKAIFDRTGEKPVVISSDEYSSVYDGVSYVRPWAVRLHWWKGIEEMKKLAMENFGGGTVVQFWHEPPKNDDTIGFKGRTWTTLQSHGHNHGVDISLDPDYGTSMARRCGFSRDEWINLPLVFDLRDEKREEYLARNCISPRKPTILYNFAGISSPFAATPDVLQVLRMSGNDFHLVNLGALKALRIYDLLGIYDRAAGLITSDTSTAHLAVGSKIPTVWYTVDGWCSSVPKGNCAMHCKYSQARLQLRELASVIQSWRAAKPAVALTR